MGRKPLTLRPAGSRNPGNGGIMRGGARPGAGRKPGPQEAKPWAGRKPHTWTLKQGDTLALWIGGASGNVATIEVHSRNVLYMRLDDGTEVKLVR